MCSGTDPDVTPVLNADCRRFFLDINMIWDLCDRAEQCLAQDR